MFPRFSGRHLEPGELATLEAPQIEGAAFWIEPDLPSFHGEGSNDNVQLMTVSVVQLIHRQGIGVEAKSLYSTAFYRQ